MDEDSSMKPFTRLWWKLKLNAYSKPIPCSRGKGRRKEKGSHGM